MSTEYYRLPETAIQCDDCFNPDFLFSKEANEIAQKIETILDTFCEEEQTMFLKQKALYQNNIIGVLGNRGTGKTTLISSIAATFKSHPEKAPFQRKDGFRLYPLTEDLIDPKIIPDCIGIVDLTIAALFNDFRNIVDNMAGTKEDTINSIYEQFDSLSKTVQMLSVSSRKDAIENPSDLYDVASLIQVREAIEKLVNNLLQIKGGIARSAYLILVDDFDLDVVQSPKMALDIISILNVKGLIFLINMDDKALHYEIARSRLKQLSDLGPYPDSSAGQRAERDWLYQDRGPLNYSFMTMSRLANQYAQQVLAKLIPLDFRVRMKGRSIEEAGTLKFREMFSTFCSWIFGFAPTWTKSNNKSVGRPTDRYLASFFAVLSKNEDIRARNQAINQILKITKDRKIAQSQPDFSEQLYIDLLREALDVPLEKLGTLGKELWRKILRDLAWSSATREEKDAFYTSDGIGLLMQLDGDVDFDIYEFGRSFFEAHPAAVGAYESMVSEIKSSSRADQILQDYHAILEIFAEGIGDIVPAAEDGSTPSYFELCPGSRLSSTKLKENLFSNSREQLKMRIGKVLTAGYKNNKKDLYSLMSALDDYLTKRPRLMPGPATFIKEIYEELNTKWKGDAETKRESIDKIMDALTRIQKRI